MSIFNYVACAAIFVLMAPGSNAEGHGDLSDHTACVYNATTKDCWMSNKAMSAHTGLKMMYDVCTPLGAGLANGTIATYSLHYGHNRRLSADGEADGMEMPDYTCDDEQIAAGCIERKIVHIHDGGMEHLMDACMPAEIAANETSAQTFFDAASVLIECLKTGDLCKDQRGAHTQAGIQLENSIPERKLADFYNYLHDAAHMCKDSSNTTAMNCTDTISAAIMEIPVPDVAADVMANTTMPPGASDVMANTTAPPAASGASRLLMDSRMHLLAAMLCIAGSFMFA